jgi:predicted phage terminase large subunit-like protein
MDRDFFEQREFLKPIAMALQKVESGEIKSLSVSMPPRAGKSYITSLFCAWTLGRNPTESVMRNTCTATLYIKFSYDVRAIVKSDKFSTLFPQITLSDDKKNLQGWNTNFSKQVGYFGAGVGGTIIGFGATKVAITDDLYRGIEDALSDTTNDRIQQWKQSTHDSRFESGCARVDIGTRWSVKDVIGTSIESKVYDESIIVSALDAEDQSFCEAVMTTEEYHDKRLRTAKEIWLAEYMQQPVDMAGRLFGDLKFTTPEELHEIIEGNKSDAKPTGIDGVVGYIDVADQGNDYLALAVCAIINGSMYIVDYLFTRENTDVTIPLCAGVLSKWNASYCRVESNSMGAMFSRNLQRLLPNTKLLQVHNTTNKDTRIIMQSAWVQMKFNFVVTGDAHQNQFVANILGYSKEGKNKNDDAPDCIAGLSIFVQSMFKHLI